VFKPKESLGFATVLATATVAIHYEPLQSMGGLPSIEEACAPGAPVTFPPTVLQTR
jgi:hypothetical protein